MTAKLTKDQEKVFASVQAFFTDPDCPAIVIVGSAGTGKTFITKYIVDHIMDTKRMSIVAIAPTHKARRVLSKRLNQDRFLEIPSLTVASILGKMREHSFRVAGYAALCGVLSGSFAATAPVSIPLYMLWDKRYGIKFRSRITK